MINYKDISNCLKSLGVDLLRYGAAAQTYFKYNTENLANAGLSAEQKLVATAEFDSSQISKYEAIFDAYIAATRALHELTLYGMGEKSPLAEQSSDCILQMNVGGESGL